MLDKSSLIAFAATQNPEQAKHFYGEVLGLQLMSDEQWAMVFNANGTTLMAPESGASVAHAVHRARVASGGHSRHYTWSHRARRGL